MNAIKKFIARLLLHPYLRVLIILFSIIGISHFSYFKDIENDYFGYGLSITGIIIIWFLLDFIAILLLKKPQQKVEIPTLFISWLKEKAGITTGVVLAFSFIVAAIWLISFGYNKYQDYQNNKPIDYAAALADNSVESWERYLKQNPNSIDRMEIEERIIRLETETILKHKDTGKLPISNKQSKYYSSISHIQVNNGTGCVLTMRYVGNNVMKIVIPVGQTYKISLDSGNYAVAASACNSNYGSYEEFSGNHNVKYYMTCR